MPNARLLRVARWLVVGVVVFGGASALLEHVLEVRDAARLTGDDTFYAAHGRRVRYRLRGAEHPGPTIVLVSGFLGSLEQWHDVQSALSTLAPVVAYDRAGMGFSDSAEGHDAIAQAEELAGLLQAPTLAPPFVVVSYSSSAMVARVFAARHRDVVQGLVFLDPTMPELNVNQPRARFAYRRLYAKNVVGIALKALFGYMRLKQLVTNGRDAGDTSVRGKEWAAIASFHHWWAISGDALAMDAGAQEAMATPSFERIPVSVLSTTDPTASSQQRRVFEAQRWLAAQSVHGVFREASHVNHGALLSAADESRMVIDFIREFEGQMRAASGR